MARERKRESEESQSGYFRRILVENPRWIKARANPEIRDRWLTDNPGNTEIPKNVLQSLANAKSYLRRKGRKRKNATNSSGDMSKGNALLRKPRRNIDALEETIDECMVLAWNLDRAGLANVIRHLRAARNELVLGIKGT